jgi:hypothetical protein
MIGHATYTMVQIQEERGRNEALKHDVALAEGALDGSRSGEGGIENCS